MNTLPDLTQRKELEQRAAARLAWTVAGDSFLCDSADAVQNFKARGHGVHIKSGDLMMSTDTAVNLSTLDAAFLGGINARSIIAALERAGAQRVTLTRGARLQVGELEAEDVAEGDPKPLSSLTFTTLGAPTKAAATVLLTAETLRALDRPTQLAIANVLASAAARAVDRLLVTALTAGSPVAATMTALLGALTAPQSPVLIGSLTSLLVLSAGVLRDLQTLNIPVIVTPAAGGALVALDAAALIVAEDQLGIQVARDASVTLAGSPAVDLSLWQANLAALRAEVFVRIGVRAGSVSFAGSV